MAPHSSTLAWKIPWMEEPGRLSDFTFTFHFHAVEKEMAPHSCVLAWRIPGTAEPGGLPSMVSHRVGHDWSDLAAVAAANIYHVRSIGLFRSWNLTSNFTFGRNLLNHYLFIRSSSVYIISSKLGSLNFPVMLLWIKFNIIVLCWRGW